MVNSATQDSLEKEIKESTLPLVIDIYASWCGPCQQMLPIFEELSKELNNKAKFLKINIDEARTLAIKYGVTSIPTFIFIKNKKVIDKATGYLSKEDLKEKIEALLK